MHPTALAFLHLAAQSIGSIPGVVESAADNDNDSGEIVFVLNSGESYVLKLAEHGDGPAIPCPPSPYPTLRGPLAGSKKSWKNSPMPSLSTIASVYGYFRAFTPRSG
jgi:hypothetical protein